MSDFDPNAPLYDGMSQNEWLDVLKKSEHWNTRHLLVLLGMLGMQSTYLDIGCGLCEMVIIAGRLGINAWGVDQFHYPDYDGFYRRADLSTAFSLGDSGGASVCELVTCIEVAEHIPPDKHPIFCDTVAHHVKKGGHLVFSSAHPGQEGEQHIGVRSAFEWKGFFYDRGLTYKPILTTQLQLLWSNIGSPLYWLPANAMVFDR